MDSPSTSSVARRKPETREGSPNLRTPSSSRTHDRDSDEVAHVLDERRQQALREVDEAPYGSFHTRVVIVAGVGFMAEACVCRIHPSMSPPASHARRMAQIRRLCD
jgi:hypothetical protein